MNYRPEVRDYIITVSLSIVAYVALLVALGEFHAGGPLLYVLAMAPAIPIGFVALAALRFMQKSDEFVRTLTMKRFVLAASATYAAAAAWGFCESYANAPHLPAWAVFPAHWAFLGLISPFVTDSK